MTHGEDRRLKDFAGTVVLLLMQAAVWRAAMFLSHGDGGPALRYGGFALLMLTLAVCVWRVARTRPAAWVALGGGALQVGVSLATLILR